MEAEGAWASGLVCPIAHVHVSPPTPPPPRGRKELVEQSGGLHCSRVRTGPAQTRWSCAGSLAPFPTLGNDRTMDSHHHLWPLHPASKQPQRRTQRVWPSLGEASPFSVTLPPSGFSSPGSVQAKVFSKAPVPPLCSSSLTFQQYLLLPVPS